MAFPKKIPKQWQKLFSSKYHFLTLLQNKRNECTEYHGTSIPVKSQFYSKYGSPTFLLFRPWNLVLYLSVLTKAKFFWKPWPDKLSLNSKLAWKRYINYMCFWGGLQFVLKNVLAIPQGFINSPWCNNSSRTYQELVQGDFYSFDQEKVSSLLICITYTHKNVTKRKTMLTSISYLAFVTKGPL